MFARITLIVGLVMTPCLQWILLCAAREPARTAPPPPPTRPVQPAKSAPRPSVEPTEAQLPPVDPVWHQNGWRAVVPHAYVLRRLLAVRGRPEATAPAAFYLKGGTRVPVLEQRPEWWRIGWTQSRTGWA